MTLLSGRRTGAGCCAPVRPPTKSVSSQSVRVVAAMARAEEVLAGATLTVADNRQDYGEDRFITIGFLDAAMVVLVWTPRDGAHRIISMRKANERERTLYGPRF